MTTFENKIQILNIYRIMYENVEEHDLFNFYMEDALLLAASLHQDLCTPTQKGIETINNSWDLFLETLGVEDKGFESLDEILDLVPEE